MLLVLVMLLGMIPVTSLAAESAPVSPAATTETPSVQAEPAAEETKALGVTFTCGEKSETVAFVADQSEYTVVLHEMPDVTMTVNGTTESDTVTVNGSAYTSARTYSLECDPIPIKVVINETTYTLNVSDETVYQLTSMIPRREDVLTNNELVMTPAFDPEVHSGYTVSVPDNISYGGNVYLYLTVTPDYGRNFHYWQIPSTEAI